MRPYYTLAFAQLAVGAAAIFARFALTGAGPIAVSASRLTIAAIALLVVLTGPYSRQQTILAACNEIAREQLFQSSKAALL